ncbi:MAG: TetR/AcrR family transcriptional regulator [Solirubrobacteraceae bacterium]
MIEAAGELGYAEATVAQVIARAGVSRKAFYEHFPNRQECFLEASDVVSKRLVKSLKDSYRTPANANDGAEAAIESLLQQTLARPQGARLIMHELGALGRAGITRRERLFSAGETLIEQHFGLAGAGPTPNPIARALMGGVNAVLYARATSHRQVVSPTLVAELMSWLSSYAPVPSSVAKLRTSPWRPDGNYSPAPPAQDHRGRILHAVTALSASKGYVAVRGSDIRRQAGISAHVFRDHFKNKEEAFLSGHDAGQRSCMAFTDAACRQAPDWPRAVRAGIAGLFSLLSRESNFAYLALVDSLVASARTAAQTQTALKAYERRFLRGMRHAGHTASPVASEAIVGGLFELCVSYTLQGRAQEIATLAGPATYIALAPVIGRKQAAQIACSPT